MKRGISKKAGDEIISVLQKYKIKPEEAVSLLELLKLTIWQCIDKKG